MQLEPEAYNVPGGAREIAARAEQFRKQGDAVKARIYFEAALKKEPQSQWIRAHLAETLAAMAAKPGMARHVLLEEAIENFNQAIKLYQEAISAENSEGNKQDLLQVNYAWTLAHRAELYRSLKRYEEALNDLNQAIELRPNYTWAYAHRGAVYRFMAEYDQALADFGRAVELAPNYAWAIAWQARTYELLEQYDKALADFNRAAALDPAIFTDLLCEQAMLLSYLGQYAEAIECCRQALLKNPDNHFALYNIAVCKTRWQGLANAAADIAQAKAKLLSHLDSPEQGLVLYRLAGLAALEINAKDQALTYLEEAILLDEEALEFARHDLAWLHLRQEPRFQTLVTHKLKGGG